jgi:hypothetical protein
MAGKPQDMLLLAANVFASVFDFLEDVEKGETPLTAATSAVRKGKKRAKALRKGAMEAAEATEMFGGRKQRRTVGCACGSGLSQKKCHGIVGERIGVVENKPLFSLCACGCGLPQGQCQGRSAGGGKR